jgi:peroxiredoxin
MKHLLFPVLLSIYLLNACITPTTEYSRAAPGIWRGVLELEPYNVPVNDKDSIYVLYEQFKEGDLPFNFEIKYLDDERMVFEFINGDERIVCDSIRYGRDRSAARDTFDIYFPEYQSFIHAQVRGGFMQGYWETTTKKDSRIPFRAVAGKSHRFTPLQETPAADLSGQWAALFGVDGDTPDKAIGEFKQTGNRLTGTFRTETGDYRFLEGTIQGRKFWLSCFDGSHAFRFSGVVQGDSLNGEFRSGRTFRTLWKGWKDPNFRLGNPDTLTMLKPGARGLSFKLINAEGEPVVYPSPAFDGKISIFTIMGTWCPNCRDEAVFLRDFLKENPELARQIQVVGLAFERPGDSTRIQQHLRLYQEKMGLPYPLAYAGKADKLEAARVFPELNHVLAFPTMIILDKQGQVRRIHTGFDGPATSKYAEFKQAFGALIADLTSEGKME